MEKLGLIILTLSGILLLLCTTAAADYMEDLARWALKVIEYRVNVVVRLILCSLWYIAAGILALIIVIAGLEYMTSDDLDSRNKAKTRLVQGVIGLIMLLIACPLVNYVVHGSDVKEFRCDCTHPSPPTTTTTTSTTTTYVIITITTTTSTTTTSTTSTTLEKASGGRFLLIGNHKYNNWHGYNPEDMYGVIFRMDGTIYRNPFYIDNNPGPVTLAVGTNRFFIAYGSHAVVLDWEGDVVVDKFTTKTGFSPVKVIQTGDKFYLLLSPYSGGGCVMQVYDLEGDLKDSWDIDIDRINYFRYSVTGVQYITMIPEGDMAFGGGKFFIVWFDETTSRVDGIIYGLNGNKIEGKFTIKTDVSANCIVWSVRYVHPQVEAGSKYFMVMFNGRSYLCEIDTGDFVAEKSCINCVHDLIYGNGRFMAAEYNDATYYDEDGNKVDTGEFKGHGDQITSLAYGNKMFVGIVAIHKGNRDGIGISFLDSTGTHILDALPLVMAESPGWAAYDW